MMGLMAELMGQLMAEDFYVMDDVNTRKRAAIAFEGDTNSRWPTNDRAFSTVYFFLVLDS